MYDNTETEQKPRIGILIVFILIVLALVAAIASILSRNTETSSDTSSSDGSTSVEQAYTALQNVKTKPSVADKQGGITLSRNGVNQPVENAPTVAVYMDFMCSGCGNFNRKVDPTLKRMMDAGQVNIELHPMSFGDRWSSDKLSTRGANMLLKLTELDPNPDRLLDFVANMYASDFQPDENSGVKTSDDQLVGRATMVGISEDTARKALTDEYTEWLKAINSYTPMRPELWNTSGDYKGSMTTPTITINGEYWNIIEVDDLKAGLLAKLGLTEEQVGDADVRPNAS